MAGHAQLKFRLDGMLDDSNSLDAPHLKTCSVFKFLVQCLGSWWVEEEVLEPLVSVFDVNVLYLHTR